MSAQTSSVKLMLREACRPRYLALPVTTLAVLATAMPMASSERAAPSPGTALDPLAAVSVSFTPDRPRNPVDFGLLGFNDFHGNIDPPSGSSGTVLGTPAGGVEWLATTVKELRARHAKEREPVLTVGAGDSIGASPLVSAAFHDEPTIEELTGLGLQINAVGNHEFDEGVAELQRMQNGGCHPVDGCQDGDGFAGAGFQYLAANVVSKATGEPILPAATVRKVGGVKVGFIGMTLKGTPGIVNPAGVTTVDFLDEATTANFWAAKLRREQGVKAFVLLLHEGGQQANPTDVSGCDGFTGPLTSIVSKLRPEFGLVVSGHTHRFYTCALPNSGGTTLATSAGSFGTIVTDIDVTMERGSGRFVSARAQNKIVENGVPDGNGGWLRNPDGSFLRNTARIDAPAKRIADKYRQAVAPIANRVVGRQTADLPQAANPAGESPLGDVIADAQLGRTQGAGAQIALMNPGGIRTSLTFNASAGGEAPGEVTFGECFAVQPFNNLVVTITLSGAQLKDVLEQQFVGFHNQTVQRILQVSAGFSYSYTSTAAPGSRVSAMALNGTPIDPAQSYRVTVNDFLANGGDGFTDLTAGSDRATAPGFDVDALVEFFEQRSPVAPGPADRITKLG